MWVNIVVIDYGGGDQITRRQQLGRKRIYHIEKGTRMKWCMCGCGGEVKQGCVK